MYIHTCVGRVGGRVKVENECVKLEVALEDQGLDEDEIEEQVAAHRTKLLAALEAEGKQYGSLDGTHARAAAKEEKNAKFRQAIRADADYTEGAAFDKVWICKVSFVLFIAPVRYASK